MPRVLRSKALRARALACAAHGATWVSVGALGAALPAGLECAKGVDGCGLNAQVPERVDVNSTKPMCVIAVIARLAITGAII